MKNKIFIYGGFTVVWLLLFLGNLYRLTLPATQYVSAPDIIGTVLSAILAAAFGWSTYRRYRELHRKDKE